MTASAGQRQVVAREAHVAVAERLEHADLLALRLHQAPEHDVEHEGGDEQEQRRDEDEHGAQAADARVEVLGRLLLVAAVGVVAAVRRKAAIDRGHDVAGHGAGAEPHHDVVEGAAEVEGGLERRAQHPGDAVALVVRRHHAGRQLEHEVGRDADADDAQPPQPSVEHGGDAVARPGVRAFGERLVEHDLVVALGARQPPRAQAHGVERRARARVERDQVHRRRHACGRAGRPARRRRRARRPGPRPRPRPRRTTARAAPA